MKQKVFFLLLLILVAVTSFSQNNKEREDDHLKPVDSIFNLSDRRFNYYSQIRQVLFDGLTDSPKVRYLVKPSFTPENVLDVEYDRDSNIYFLVYHICEEMIWSNERWESVKVNKYKKEIDSESVKLLKSLFAEAALTTKYDRPAEPDKDGLIEISMGLDGTEYCFTVNNIGQHSGMVWSPTEKSRMGRLVAVGDELIELAKNDAETVVFDKELQSKIKELIKDLKK